MSEASEVRAAVPRERLTPPQREQVARRLQVARGRDPHLASRLADALEVSANRLRALRRRKERGEELSPKRGRPRHAEDERARVGALVERELGLQGDVGWRRVLAGIEKREGAGKAPVTLVQQETKAAKLAARARARRALERVRTGHEVLARDAMWAQDAAHLGRVPSGEKVEAEFATDRATTRTPIASAGPPASGEDVVELLATAKSGCGALPFAWQTDGGPAYRSDAVERYLEREKVIHLVSRPHTPTDNAVAEAKNRELKEEAALGSGVLLLSASDAAQRLSAALERVDAGRLRASRGYKTAQELDREMPSASDVADRSAFYGDARSAIDAAVLGLTDVRQIRKAQQDAIWRTLEKHHLARTHAGLRRVPCRPPTPVAEQPPGVVRGVRKTQPFLRGERGRGGRRISGRQEAPRWVRRRTEGKAAS